MIHCLHCSAETSNGLALCDLSQRVAETALDFIPIYFRNLARWRPGRAGSRPVPGSRVLYDGSGAQTGTGDRISDTLDEATTALLTSARQLVKARTLPRPYTLADAVMSDDLPADFADALNDDQPQLMALLCAGFKRHLTSIATTDWCGDLVHELEDHEGKLRRFTEQTIPGWYGGTCRQVVFKTLEGDVLCGTPTYVIPGLTWVLCQGCGISTHARDHLDVVLEEARDWVARPREIAGALVALLDTEMDVERLWERTRRWGRPGSIVRDKATGEVKRVIPAGPLNATSIRHRDADGDEAGPRLFRLGDVLDQLQREEWALKRTA